jgi:hypothetical protein
MTTPSPSDPRRNSVTIIALLAGLVLGLVILLLVFVLFDDDGEPPTTTAATTQTTAPTTTQATTTAGPTTTAAPTTTQATTTTTFGTTDDKEGEGEGEPGGHLTDVRVGEHDGFTRVVFEFDGTGIPMYRVTYADPPFATSGEGAEVPVDGTFFLHVLAFPARTVDIEDPDFPPTYTGPDRFAPGLGVITEVVLIDDFEAAMTWVIGLSAEKGFTVDTLTDPVRLVIDIGE